MMSRAFSTKQYWAWVKNISIILRPEGKRMMRFDKQRYSVKSDNRSLNSPWQRKSVRLNWDAVNNNDKDHSKWSSIKTTLKRWKIKSRVIKNNNDRKFLNNMINWWKKWQVFKIYKNLKHYHINKPSKLCKRVKLSKKRR
jgi:hypothetical protein